MTPDWVSVRTQNSYVYRKNLIDQGWRIFLRALSQIFINFEDILSHAYGNFEEQNKVL
jgi:hypothetical protein